jgi:RNA polymerase sigma factor (sigma-70 family)
MVLDRVSGGTPSAVGDTTPTEAGAGASSEAAIILSVRRGDLDAYERLYERHVGAARRLARNLLSNPADAEDVVSEVFASILSAIQNGRGPRDGFRSYALGSVRFECHRTGRRRGRLKPVDSPDAAIVASSQRTAEPDPFARRDEVDVLQQAFQTLPRPFREVLWRTEVEGRSHQEIAEDTGTTPQAVAAQAMRARRALGGAYLQRHLPGSSPTTSGARSAPAGGGGSRATSPRARRARRGDRSSSNSISISGPRRVCLWRRRPRSSASDPRPACWDGSPVAAPRWSPRAGWWW